MGTDAFSMREMMVIQAAREIKDQDKVFVGMRLPLLAFYVAKATHAPKAIAFFESGIVRDTPAGGPLRTMCDLPNITEASMCTDLLEVMAVLQRGDIDIGIIGAAQVDRFGNVNTSMIKDGGKLTALPGSGGACDIACLAKRFVVMMPLERRRFVKRVSYVTSPGYGEGGGWRRRAGLKRGGPSCVITDKAIFRFDERGEMYLDAVFPGASLRGVLGSMGFRPRVPSPLKVCEPPSTSELSHLRRLDPERFWIGSQ